MRRAARTDDNQTEIVEALRAIGASVRVTSMIGQGFPDLVVGIFGKNHLLEIKDGKKPKSAQGLTADEAIFINEWKGKVKVVSTVEEAIAALK